MPESWLTVADAARQLRCSEKTVRKLIAAGSIPVARVGRLIRISQQALDDAMANALSYPPVPTASTDRAHAGRKMVPREGKRRHLRAL